MDVLSTSLFPSGFSLRAFNAHACRHSPQIKKRCNHPPKSHALLSGWTQPGRKNIATKDGTS
eukprot:9660290-Alexandrium_andersonii.AAC.1